MLEVSWTLVDLITHPYIPHTFGVVVLILGCIIARCIKSTLFWVLVLGGWTSTAITVLYYKNKYEKVGA